VEDDEFKTIANLLLLIYDLSKKIRMKT